jgi:glycosyltransferase involved in cell wall biosynthesis
MGEDLRKKIVISCVNFTEGGPLSVIYDCLDAGYLQPSEHNVTVLVHDERLFTKYLDKFTFLAFPEVKTSWFKRLHFEFIHSQRLSDQLKPDIWISLHDITPNVNCPVQVVYCHNPAPFYRVKLADVLFDYKFFLFSLFYKYLYRINIKRNKYVIVQQKWLRKKFRAFYGVDTIVAYPSLTLLDKAPVDLEPLQPKDSDGVYTFFYPAFPRTFKNIETLLKAGVELAQTRSDFQILLTIDGTQNTYSSKIYKSFSQYSFIKFIGKQTRAEVEALYASVDCLVFPSRLETWGLPISEFKFYNKPILAADLDYAHETAGDYNRVKFFDVDSPSSLSAMMNNAIGNALVYDQKTALVPEAPFFSDWYSLLNFLTNIPAK